MKLLVDRGARIDYIDPRGNSAAIDAGSILHTEYKAQALELYRYLVERGADLSLESKDGGSVAGQFVQAGEYELLREMIKLGAPIEPLGFTPLAEAIVLGTVEDVRSELSKNSSLTETDYHCRTPLTLALIGRDLDKTKALIEAGCALTDSNYDPVVTSLEYGFIEGFRLLLGYLPEDEKTPAAFLDWAKEARGMPMKREVLSYLSGLDYRCGLNRSLNEAKLEEVWELLRMGAESRAIDHDFRVELFPGENSFDGISQSEFELWRSRRFGSHNPERFESRFLERMARIGCGGYTARVEFDAESGFRGTERNPVWCADRYGQSITILPDGRIVEIAGEHEDGGDPEFCIYNDVFVHHPNGAIEIYGYPKDVFPPTDFHSATLVGDWIYIVGSLGYDAERADRPTWVYRLSTADLHIEPVFTTGAVPVGIHKHGAFLDDQSRLCLWGGRIIMWDETDEIVFDNTDVYALDLDTLRWQTIGTYHDPIGW